MIEIKRLHKKDIPQVINLSLEIFKPKKRRDDYYHDSRRWQEYFKQKGIILGVFVNEKLAGYLFSYEREPGTKNIHCWMAGVTEGFRKQGLLKKLMKNLIAILKKSGYKVLTINTYPEKYPAMFSYLKKYGFEQYKQEKRKYEDKMTIKYFFRKTIFG